MSVGYALMSQMIPIHELLNRIRYSAMGYYEVPSEVVKDSVRLAAWMKKAIDVAGQGQD